jgi:hypothetical protein
MTLRWISLVPSPTIIRERPEVAVDVVFGGLPYPSWTRTAFRAISMAVSEANNFAMPGFHVASLATVTTSGCVVGELSGRGELGGHVGQVMADGLVLPDGLTEALALLRVGQGVF